MFHRVSFLAAAAVLLAASCSASTAQAQLIGAGGYGLGFYNYSGNYFGNNYRQPYYALYPPVYYSYPVARPYGYSPFAYPPGVMTPEAPQQKVAPVEYINPLVPQSSSPAPDKTAGRARMYHNPFVKQPQVASRLAVARQDEP